MYLLNIPCSSDGKELACNAEDPGSIPELGRSPEEGQSNGVDMTRRLEGPVVNKDVLKMVQDWTDEFCDQASGMV